MNRILIILFVSLGLSGCITTEDMNSASENISNTFPSKKVEPTIIEVQKDINKIKFTLWECFEYKPIYKFQKHILTIGYFTEYEEIENNVKIGMLFLENTSSKIPTIYSLKGVQHEWSWGNEDKTLFQIIIDSKGTGRYWDFTGAKPNEERKSKETYECKPPETILVGDEVINELEGLSNKEMVIKNPILSQSLIDDIKNHIGKCWKLELKNKKEIDENTIVSLQVFTTPDGVVSKINIIDKNTYNSDVDFRLIADSAKRAVFDCSPLPIPKNKSVLFKNFIMDFDYKFALQK
tara:strand:+ start:115 stop:993 length:879 start_codon:yes stop_codon:yes gene_type:complete